MESMRRKEVKILICVVFRPTAPSPGWPSVNTVMNSVGGWTEKVSVSPRKVPSGEAEIPNHMAWL